MAGTVRLSIGDADASATNPVPVVVTASDINLGNVDVASIAAGDNNIGNVDVASIAAGDNNIGNVDVASIAAGTTYIGQAASPIQFVTVSMTTPIGALGAGDVVAATQVVAACTRANDVAAFLDSITLIDTDDQKAILTAVFFSADTALGTEDAAPDIDDTEALTILGSVEFIVADYIDLGGASYATKKNVGLAVLPATGTDDIYMALYTPLTSTPTYASGIITVRLGFRS